MLAGFGQAEIYVITHRDNPIQALNPSQVRDLYLARNQNVIGDKNVIIYDRSDLELRQRFIEKVVGMNVRQFDAYWARLIFAGRVLPLSEAAQGSELLTGIDDNINAIGYTDEKPSSNTIKTLLVINE